MAVAEKPITERAPRTEPKSLPVSSLLGAVFVLFSLGLLFSALPMLWTEVLGLNRVFNPFLSEALSLFVKLGVIIGLFLLGRSLERNANPPAGSRAGAFSILVGLVVFAWLTLTIGGWLETRELGTGIGAITTLVIGVALLAVGTWVFLRPGFQRWLVQVEGQGWFHGISYKHAQGVKVRRSTLIGLLVVGLLGIWAGFQNDILRGVRGITTDWYVALPFTRDSATNSFAYVPLLFSVELIFPLLLTIALVWFAWRVVNWPVFADFLIATEAEMNKVSWTTRRRLIQDTAVVLVTVVLMTVFLFAVDYFWIRVLTWRPIGVLQIDLKAEQLKQQEKTQW